METLVPETAAGASQEQNVPTILLVDDEVNILSSLRRLFRPVGYRILTAESGAMGLSILEEESVDLVISDMRMPNMTGAEFLKQVKTRWPNVLRILLTGYSELSSTIAAINDGGVYRYLSKPWEEQDLLHTVAQALEYQQLEKEKARLEALTHSQNEKLRHLNENLEREVNARTEELRQTVLFLENAQERLKKNFFTMLKVFSNFLEMREGAMAGNANRVGELGRRLARKMQLSEAQAQELMIAGLLHAIGKISLPDEILKKPFDQLTPEERLVFATHPEKAQMALMPIEQMTNPAKLIRHQHERYDGKGFPDSLAGENIPIGARILAVVSDFESLRNGTLIGHSLSPEDALAFLQKNKKVRYDPSVVAIFELVLQEPDALLAAGTKIIRSADLQPGMKLADDLKTPDGVLLLSHDHVLTQPQILQIQKFERTEGKTFTITVYSQPVKPT
ncbi:response regulator [Leeia sp. TBRC 13508]|uniref:Response regulator n=1 Tax=Leeia speluncae TaxID=2884804 RepID=A0ABS8D8U8_9NEIS|nr:HD domain-containing phosphohydrolase [Leeia speluncae]MCB6184594.1 response regulator [Leeia speluncae]